MKVTRVCCQGCGADLEVDETIRFVTCNYCHARLEIVHDSSVTHTRQLDKISRTTDELAAKVKILELQNDLECLDREWDNLRGTLLVRGKDGHASEPSAAGAVIGGLIAIIFGIFFMSVAGKIGAGGIFPLFGLLFIGFAIFGIIRTSAKASEFQTARDRYQSARARLVDRLESERAR